jgi:hypothetical protein
MPMQILVLQLAMQQIQLLKATAILQQLLVLAEM